MSANNAQYMQLFGMICNEAVVMARCACVACNSCTCACSCRAVPETGGNRMVNISRFTHSYDLGDAVALYHSLRMKPVYLSKDAFGGLAGMACKPFCDKIENAPERIYTEVQELAKFKILTRDENEDDRVLQFVRSKIPSPAVNVCYMILSEQCNLACKYCFLGNNDCAKRSNFFNGKYVC